MFNIGFTELVFLFAIALLVIGPKQLPEVARVVGRLLNEFRRATEDLTGSFHQAKSKTTDELRDTHMKVLKETKVPEINIEKDLLGDNPLDEKESENKDERG